ncbi:MAG TPA: TetR family transcriptional regulator [Solirubrobacteraceae bacterium]|jgi:AcrR family transcriptional regulator
MLLATAQAARERGAAGVSVADIVSGSGVSRRTFYEVFRDRDECMAATLEEAIERAAAAVLPAWRTHSGWREQARAALAAFLGFLDEEPLLGTFLVFDSLGAGEPVLRRRLEAVEVLVAAVDEGRSRARSVGKCLSEVTAEGVVGAVLSIVQGRLLAGDGSKAPRDGGQASRDAGGMAGMLGQLMAIVVLPYLGPAAAAKELNRPPADPPEIAPQPRANPLGKLAIRLTYRTAMVMHSIAAHPGGSNRAVALQAGIADPGQISKLLARLVRAGLIENAAHPGRGEANAWRLTATGVEVEHAIGESASTTSGGRPGQAPHLR